MDDDTRTPPLPDPRPAGPGDAAPPSRGHQEGRPVVVLATLAALLAGGLSAVQSRANGQLARDLGAPVDASLWSFGSGWVLLVCAALLVPRTRRGVRTIARAVRSGDLPARVTIGGLLGGLFVAIQTFAVPTLGVALFTIAIVGGQTTSSLVVDRLGLGPAGRVHVTLGRVVAALLTFTGVAVAATARGGGGPGGGIPVLPVALTVLAGAGIAVQQALNGRVNRVSGDALSTSLVNFSWGLGLLVGWALVLLLRGALHVPRSWDAPWWAFLGGVIGVGFVAIGAVVVHHLGVLVAALVTLTGQLLTAVLMDLGDPAARAHVGGRLLLGVALTLAASLGAGVAAQRERRVAR